MPTSPYETALDLLGRDTVLIPITAGTKAPPRGFRWRNLTLAESLRPDRVETLQGAPTIAVLFGSESGDLVGVDFDRDFAADEFLALNPSLAGSLRTRGRRGCALWLRMMGDYPQRAAKFKSARGEHLGEWRGGGNCYSIISGQHKDGGAYQVLVHAPALATEFSSIQWPKGWKGTPLMDAMQSAKQKNGSESAWPSACDSAWHPPQGGCSPLTECKGSDLDSICWLSETFVEKHWTPQAHQRNEFIKTAIPFLFHAMCAPAVLGVVMRYYDNNKTLFRDSREQHKREALFHLDAVSETFVGSLGDKERAWYLGLRGEKERAAMRICRHLANLQSEREDCVGRQFVLDYERLGFRLLTDSKAAQRLMRRFQGRIVVLVRNGTKRQHGRPTSASVWRYILPSS